MLTDLCKPKMQEYKITIQKGTTFCKNFSITNAIGQTFNFADHYVRGYIRKEDSCRCPEIDFDVSLVDSCSKIQMFIDARTTEKFKQYRPYFFYIDLNPREKLEDLDRPIEISELNNFNLSSAGDLPFTTFTNYKNVEPLLEHEPTYRLVKGTIKVEA